MAERGEGRTSSRTRRVAAAVGSGVFVALMLFTVIRLAAETIVDWRSTAVPIALGILIGLLLMVLQSRRDRRA